MTPPKINLEPSLSFPDDRTIHRNERCPCGSGRKFKKCHLVYKSPGVRLQILRKAP